MRANAKAGLQLVPLFVVLVLLAQPLAAALDCWWIARTTSQCDGQLGMSQASAHRPRGAGNSSAPFCCEVSPLEKTNPALLANGAVRASLAVPQSPVAVVAAPAPGIVSLSVFAGTGCPSGHSRLAQLCTFLI